MTGLPIGGGQRGPDFDPPGKPDAEVMRLCQSVVTFSDASGYIVDEAGIGLALMKDIKEVRRGRVADYAAERSSARMVSEGTVWDVPVDVALPCATQNELTGADAKVLLSNGVLAVAEGANMPTTPDAAVLFQDAGVLFGPGKAANAGGVATLPGAN